MGTPYNGPVLTAPPQQQRKPYTGQVLSAPPPSADLMRDDSEVVVRTRGPNAPYQPAVLPFRHGSDGIEMVHSDLTRSIADAFTAPGRAARGEMTFEQAKREGANMAGVVATGGIGIPRAVIPAGAMAMNAMGPPIKAGAVATGRALQTVADPMLAHVGIDVDGVVGRTMLRRIRADNPGISDADAVSRAETELKRLGSPGMLVDTSKSLQKLGRNMVQAPGETAQMAETALDARRASQGTRLVSSVKQGISPKNFHDELDAIELRQKEMAGPLYKEAFGANKSVASPLIDRILMTPAGREALGYARDRVQNRMSRMAVPDKELTEQMGELVARGEMDPVKGGVATGLKLETLDLIKQALGEQEQMLKRKVINGTAKKGELTDIGDLRRDLTSELDRLDITGHAGPNSFKAQGGTYARARRVYSDEASLKDALEQGRAFMKGDEEVTRKVFMKMTDSQKEAFRIGVAREMVGSITKTGALPPSIRNALMQSNGLRSKISFIAPNKKSLDKLISDIEREVQFEKTDRGTRNVSQTASILMEEGALAKDAADTATQAGGVVMDLGRGNVPAALGRMIQWGTQQLSRLKMPQQARDQIGRLLFSQDPAEQERALNLIRAQMRADRPAGR